MYIFKSIREWKSSSFFLQLKKFRKTIFLDIYTNKTKESVKKMLDW